MALSHACIQAIVEAASLNEDGRKRKIVVTGCLAQRYADQLAADLPEADLVVGFENYGSLPDSLREAMGLPALASTSGGVATPIRVPQNRVQVC